MSEDEDLSEIVAENNALEVFDDQENEEPTEQATGETADDADKRVVKPKRVIRNPQPKLNAETLKGKRGLTALESYFDRVKFKGHGYEEQDLSVVLKTYEYWCHRLFPKYPFDDCIKKIEVLGTKKPVVTLVKKIRYDMIVEDNDIITNDYVSDEDQALNTQFDALVDIPSTTQPQISEEMLEKIRLNKEKAERLRMEKERNRKELTESPSVDNNIAQGESLNEINNDHLFGEVTSQGMQEASVSEARFNNLSSPKPSTSYYKHSDSTVINSLSTELDNIQQISDSNCARLSSFIDSDNEDY